MHVAIIPDGNRRWARERGLRSTEGHRVAYERAFDLAEYAATKGVRYLTFYAFSTENWKRAKDEVGFLFSLLERFVGGEVRRMHERGMRIRFIGSQEGISRKLLERMRLTEELTVGNTGMMLNIAFNYGGRRDLTEAVAAIVREGVKADDVTEQVIAAHLSTRGTPPVDLVIRTSGQLRLSNYLLWEANYAELIFLDMYWPDFGREQLDQALAEFAARQRRYGA